MIKGKRVLLCEDDEFLAQLIEIALHSYGLVIDVCQSAKTALQKLSEIEYDFCISDCGLLDGKCVGFAVLCTAREKSVEVVMITGNQDDQAIVNAFSAQTHFILKSDTTIQDLRKWIKSFD